MNFIAENLCANSIAELEYNAYVSPEDEELQNQIHEENIKHRCLTRATDALENNDIDFLQFLLVKSLKGQSLKMIKLIATPCINKQTYQSIPSEVSDVFCDAAVEFYREQFE